MLTIHGLFPGDDEYPPEFSIPFSISDYLEIGDEEAEVLQKKGLG